MVSADAREALAICASIASKIRFVGWKDIYNLPSSGFPACRTTEKHTAVQLADIRQYREEGKELTRHPQFDPEAPCHIDTIDPPAEDTYGEK
ncbi:MAG: hypothetical protein JO345_30170 [Streptosporangiaceae bacterium]|nr:hypothetical protein [Streptosporangiaceae bacterium]